MRRLRLHAQSRALHGELQMLPQQAPSLSTYRDIQDINSSGRVEQRRAHLVEPIISLCILSFALQPALASHLHAGGTVF